MPRRLLKHLFAILVLLIVAGCSGGGCGGCAGCGVTPLPNGFPKEARVENAGSVRLTQSGLGFLSQNLGPLAEQLLGGMGAGGVVTFNVPTTSGSTSGIDYEICPGGPNPNANPPKCVAEINIGGAQLTITTKAPNILQISGPLPIRLQNLPADFVYFFIPDSTDIVLNGNDNCPGETQTYANVDVNIELAISPESEAALAGYSRIDVVSATINENQLKNSLHFCGGLPGAVEGLLKDLAFGQLVGPLLDTLKDQIGDQLCRKADPTLTPECPAGTSNDGGTCKFASGKCVSIALGTEGNINLSSLLASISPGTKGGLDFLFAAGGSGTPPNGGPPYGSLNPIQGGATLGMFGGALPQPVSSCVKLANMDPPQGVPIPEVLKGNTVPNWPMGQAGPHVGIALSERFFNYALSGMYDSGLLCIGLSLETLAASLPLPLDSKLVDNLLQAKGTQRLGLQDEAQTLALAIRPGAPPTAEFGYGTNLETDPLIRIGMKQFSVDFYVWSLDRFVRFMTYTIDLDVPMNITVTPDGLVPVIEKIGIVNAKITNAELLDDDADLDAIAAILTDLLASQIGSALGGAIPAINLNDQLAGLGLQLNIPETVEGQGSPGLTKVTEGTDDFLGIFATLAVAPPQPPPSNETNAVVTKKEIDPAGLTLVTATKDNAPRVELLLSSPQDNGSNKVEYQIRMNGGFWRPWTTKRNIELHEGIFRLQGRHKIEVRSRIAGEPMTTDMTPAVVDVVIDGEAPAIAVKEQGNNKAKIVVRDVVSSLDATFVRYRIDGGSWSGWTRASELQLLDVTPGGDVDVEARDEEGLVATASQAIRGKPLPSDGGCGCTVVGNDSSDGKLAGILGVMVLGAALRFGKRRSSKKAAPSAALSPKAKAIRSMRALTGIAVVTTAATFAGCNCGEETQSTTGTTTTNTTSSVPECPSCDKLNPGLAGAYTSATVVGDTIWVAGYVEKGLSEKGDLFNWGDLAVGKFDGTSVQWELVDGVPEQEVDPESYDPNGFRGGVTDPGDDVGLWTSIAAKDDGTVGVAYYDRTHRSLKFAFQKEGAWSVSTVQEKPTSDIGRYAKLAVVGGAWTIAYLAVEPGMGGAVTSGVRIASSSDGGSWTFEDAVQNTATPCSGRFCTTGNACIVETGLCTPKAQGCDPSCSAGTACVSDNGNPVCKDENGPSKLETYPNATGLYISAVPTAGGLGLVYYDRVMGNLWAASKASGSWVTTLIDGEAGGTDTGDVGIGAALAIDGQGVWHVVYSNGFDESVQYIQVKDGVPGSPEVIDDGAGIEGTLNADGRHIVGDDASILVTASGDIHVSYQDATVGHLHYAVGTPTANGHTWAVKMVPQEGFAGAFSKLVDANGTINAVHWWRAFGGAYQGDVAVVKP
ncbi:MAG: hypothetical protein IPK82_36310 [Polyangiaceae bacterium]|nr:hypothetical protein [Polyangiaceae bacterium]